ncbi:MAG: metallophosphoesterase [Bacteroidales bacterium]|nr:metallophosphoesterase [Bacteroidales bacterium]
MNNLNTIPIVGKFTDVAAAANNNFTAIKTAIDQLELSVTRSKGFFTSASALSTMYPSPVVGDWAVVQVTENNVTSNIIYKCSTVGTWSSTGTAWAGGSIDLAQYVPKSSVETSPAQESANPISSGAVWMAKRDFEGEIAEEYRYGEGLSGVVSNQRYDMPYDETTHTCTVGSQKSNTNANKKYRVNYYPQKFSKGDIIHFHGEATSQKTGNYGFTTQDPSQVTLAGLVVDHAFHFSGTLHDYYLEVPYDDAYIVYYYHTDNWVSGTRVFTLFKRNGLKDKVADIEADLTDLDGELKDLEQDSLRAVTLDLTSKGSWVRGGSTQSKIDATSLVQTSDGAVVTVVTPTSGGRFGIKFTSLPVGKYCVEFDYSGGFQSGGKAVMGGTSYTNHGDSSASAPFVESISTTQDDNHYKWLFNKTATTTFYRLFSSANWSAGDVVTITNFKITKIVNDINDWNERIDDAAETAQKFVDAAIEAGATGVTNITLTPSSSETYNAYKTSSGLQFVSNNKRLCYFPKQKVVGGQTVTFKYTGLNYIIVYQLAEKEGVTLDSSPVGKYTVSEVMLKTVNFYSTAYDGFFDSSVETDANSPTGYIKEVSFKTHPRCRRLAFVMGSTQEVTQSTSNITNNITEIILPVYDTNQLDFNVLAKQQDFEDLRDRVYSSEFWTFEQPTRKTYKKYEISSAGAISYHSSSGKYRVVVYQKPFSAGDLIKFRGETDGTSRAQRWAFVEELPTSAAELLALGSVELFSPEETTELAHDEEGNIIHRTYEHLLKVPYDGLYLIYYYYNKNWLSRTIQYSLSNSTQGKIRELDESVTSTEELIRQAKFVDSNNSVPALGLLHFSDIHGDDEAVKKVLESFNNYEDYVDDVVCTGDSVHYYAVGTSSYPHGTTWWQGTGLAEISLFVLGNHDSATSSATVYDQKEDSGAWDGKGKEWCYQNYFDAYIEETGVIMPDGYDDSTNPNYHACYWHKDYEDQKVRIIGLDCLHRFDGILNPQTGEITTAGLKWVTNEQELWLISKLNETLDSENAAYGYSVIVCCHYPIDNFSGDNEEWNDATHKFVYNQKRTGGRVMSHRSGDAVNFHAATVTSYTSAIKFNLNNRVDNGYGDGKGYYWYDDNDVKRTNYTQGSTNNIANIIQNWMGRGGKFVAWLCGHTHVDYMWYPTKYPDILCVVIDQAGCLRGTNSGDRAAGTNNRPCINYYSVDTKNGLFKIVRIGCSINRLMVEKRYMCYDYINKKVIREG